ncbi:MAG: hypothetical protein LBD92_08170 [Oscillospiraceae bacterium]|nr:hypothetical protein [Oscillospiraceae bacterium]
MIGLAVAAVLLAAAAFTRVGVLARYDEDGLSLVARVGFVGIRLLPRARRPGRPGRGGRDEKKAGRKRAGRGGPADIPVVVRAALNALGRLRRRLLIKRLTVRYSAPGAADPAAAAMMYGGLSAGAGALLALIGGAFRVRERELAADVDFTSDKPRVFISAEISLAVWEAVYAACALLPAAVRSAAQS